MAAHSQRNLIYLLAGPGTDEGNKRDNSLRCRNLGLKSCRQRGEVSERFEREILLLNLWPQTAEKVVGPSCKVWITTKQDFHSHGRSGQPSVQKYSMKVESYLCVRPRAQ